MSAVKLEKSTDRTRIRRPECSCGCLERGNLAPIVADARAGTVVDFHNCRPPKVVPEPADFEDLGDRHLLEDPAGLEEWIRARYLNWRLLFHETFGEPACGRHRCVFAAGDYIYKLPKSWRGVDDNDFEAGRRSCHLASCWIQRDGDGYPILIMERVIEVGGKNHPAWTWAIDCQQVGYSRRTGLLVAYDFGYW